MDFLIHKNIWENNKIYEWTFITMLDVGGVFTVYIN